MLKEYKQELLVLFYKSIYLFTYLLVNVLLFIYLYLCLICKRTSFKKGACNYKVEVCLCVPEGYNKPKHKNAPEQFYGVDVEDSVLSI